MVERETFFKEGERDFAKKENNGYLVKSIDFESLIPLRVAEASHRQAGPSQAAAPLLKNAVAASASTPHLPWTLWDLRWSVGLELLRGVPHSLCVSWLAQKDLGERRAALMAYLHNRGLAVLRTTDIYSVIVLKAGSPRSQCQQCWLVLFRNSGRNSPLPLSWLLVVASNPQHSLVSSCFLLITASIITWPSSLGLPCVSVSEPLSFLSLTDINHQIQSSS